VVEPRRVAVQHRGVGEIQINIRRIVRPARLGIREADFVRVEQPLRLPLTDCALVLVDVWDRHQVYSHQERCEPVIREVLLPLLHEARAAGLRVIHAPGRAAGLHYPQCRVTESGGGEWVGGTPDPDWPASGAAWVRELVEPAVQQLRADRRIHPLCEPLADEPVVADGGQLHAVLKAERRSVPFFAGFAANLCVLNRDYGMRAFHGRGYGTVLVRDGTVAIEAASTAERGLLLEASIVEAEMNFAGSVASGDLRAGLQALAP
jgi:nicotinamidase-related amidase